MNNLNHIWTLLRETDVHEIREQTSARFRLVVAGSDVAVVERIAAMLFTNLFTNVQEPSTSAVAVHILPASTETTLNAVSVDAVLFALPATREPHQERRAVAVLRASAPDLPIIVVHSAAVDESPAIFSVDWGDAVQVRVPPDAAAPLDAELIPALLQLFPDRPIALAHHLPALRAAVVRSLINETCFTNAAYAASTGVAELVPILNIPLSLADIVILTKNQILMTYKIALSQGHNGELVDVVGPIAGVLGAGFVWRQVARTLVGFIPGIGLVTKVAVAYAGTYVIGHAALNWYVHGQHLTAERMRQLYAEAAAEARARTASLLSRPRPRLRLPAPRRRKTMDSPQSVTRE